MHNFMLNLQKLTIMTRTDASFVGEYINGSPQGKKSVAPCPTEIQIKKSEGLSCFATNLN